MPRRKARAGRKAGQKRSDKRFWASDGTEWASKWEHDVYEYILQQGVIVRKCDERDSFSYNEPQSRQHCLACGSTDIVQARVYTPDLHVTPVPTGEDSDNRGYYVEAKGYFRQSQRALFARFLKERKDIDLRLVFERDGTATSKLSWSEYSARYFKIPTVCGLSELGGSGWL